VRVNGRGLWLKCWETYAINADLLFGGDRQDRFLTRYKEEIRQMQEKNKEIDGRWRQEIESAFAVRLQAESGDNPAFVPPKPTIQ
jgi:hypothetical protein